MLQHVTSLLGPPLSHCACGQHSFFRRNVAGVASCLQTCVQFDRSSFESSDLQLQRQTRYRSTNWTVVKKHRNEIIITKLFYLKTLLKDWSNNLFDVGNIKFN